MKKLNNKGLSLVELIIAVGIFALVMVVVFRMMVVSTKSYTEGNDEINAQNEAQMLMNHLDNIISDASEVTKAGGIYTIKRGTSSTAKVVIVNYLNGKLYYYEKGQVAGGSSPTDTYLMSDDVSAFYMNLSNIESHRYVSVDLTVTKAGRSYTATKNIFLRNIGNSKSSDEEGGSEGGESEESTDESEEGNSGEGGNPSGGESGNPSGGDNPSGGEETSSSKSITGIKADPATVSINSGDQITGSLIDVYYVYSDGSEAYCDSWEANPSAPTSNGSVEIKDKTYNLTTNLNVTIKNDVDEPTINGIKATWKGPGTVKMGTVLSDSNVDVVYTYTDGTTKKCTDWIARNAYYNETKTVQITDGNYTILDPTRMHEDKISFNVAYITGLEVTNNIEYLEYVDDVKLTDFTLKYKYSDNTYEDAPLSELNHNVSNDTYTFQKKNSGISASCEVKRYKIQSFYASLDGVNAGDMITKDDFFVAFKYNIYGVTYTHQIKDFTVGLPATPIEEGVQYKFVVKSDYGNYSTDIYFKIGGLSTVEYTQAQLKAGVDLTGASRIVLTFAQPSVGFNYGQYNNIQYSMSGQTVADIDVSNIAAGLYNGSMFKVGDIYNGNSITNCVVYY